MLKLKMFIITVIFSVVSFANNNLTILWSSSESQTMFSRTKIKGDFFQLSNFYEPQQNKFFCGPATATIILNALMLKNTEITKPKDAYGYNWKTEHLSPKFEPVFEKFTQNSFLNEKTDAVKSRDVFYGKPIAEKKDSGLTFSQLAKMLEVYGLKTKAVPVSELKSSEVYKKEIIKSLKDNTSFAITNFDRKVLGQNGGGHISPIVAYDQSSNNFLVLDVNPVVSEWFWVKSDTLIAAMNSKDGDNFRGYVIVSK